MRLIKVLHMPLSVNVVVSTTHLWHNAPNYPAVTLLAPENPEMLWSLLLLQTQYSIFLFLKMQQNCVFLIHLQMFRKTPLHTRAADKKTAWWLEWLKHMCHLEFSCITLWTKPVQTNIGFVSKSYLKVGCVNLPANGLAKASLIFWTWPSSAEDVSTRLISGGSPEVPHKIWA